MIKKTEPTISDEIKESIMNQIYCVRGCKVMLDRDLVKLIFPQNAQRMLTR